MSPLTAFHSEQIARFAEAYENQFRADEPGYGRASDFTWQQNDEFPVYRVRESRTCWAHWWGRELRAAKDDGRYSYYKALQDWWLREPNEHVCVVESTDGRYYI